MMSAEDCLEPDLRANLEGIGGKIGEAAIRSGRRPESVSLVAITKNVPPGRIEAAYRLGIRDFGENRVQEARSKAPQLPSDIAWHMVGQLQSNKAKEAAGLFSLVHSIDRIKTGEALNRAAEGAGKPCRGLVQVNLAGAAGQAGAPPGEIENLIEIFSRLPYLQICGLMALGPYPAEKEAIRKAFREVAAVFRRVVSNFRPGFSVLSLGMSADYEIAIEEGSTLVRIGTAIFGERRNL